MSIARSLKKTFFFYIQLYEYRDTLEFSSDYHACHSAMKNIRRYLTQDISVERIQNVFDLGIQERIRSILLEPGYDELKVQSLSPSLDLFIHLEKVV